MSSYPDGGIVEVKRPDGWAWRHPVCGSYVYHGRRKNPASAREWLRQFVGRLADDPEWVEAPVFLMELENESTM